MHCHCCNIYSATVQGQLEFKNSQTPIIKPRKKHQFRAETGSVWLRETQKHLQEHTSEEDIRWPSSRAQLRNNVNELERDRHLLSETKKNSGSYSDIYFSNC